MNAHVFTTRTSASSARELIFIPHFRTLPSMISASTRFLAQPRLIMATSSGRRARRAEARQGRVIGSLSLTRELALGMAKSPPAADTAATTAGEFMGANRLLRLRRPLRAAYH